MTPEERRMLRDELARDPMLGNWLQGYFTLQKYATVKVVGADRHVVITQDDLNIALGQLLLTGKR